MELLLLCAVTLSGFAALVFESLWFHQAGIGLGNGVWASSIVLAGFMAGVGLGNGVTARFGDGLRRPLAAYAALEITIAATGVALVYGLHLAGATAATALPPETSPLVLNLVRLGLSFLLLCVPSAAMGMTLPVLTRALASSGGFGRVLGALYGANTLGATAGALASELWLVEGLGIHGTAWVAGACDVVAALVALALLRRFPEAAPAPAPKQGGLWEGLPWLVAAFGSGLAVLALEVVWFRLLRLYVMSTPAAFSVMLAVVLLGIATGGWLAGRWLDRNPNAAVYASAIAMACSIATAFGYFTTPLTIRLLDNGRLSGLSQILYLAVPLMFPVCVASGALFPLLGASLRARLGRDAAAVGALTLANTLGAALGSLLAGFVLLPVLGMELSILAMAAVLAAIGALLAWREPGGRTVGLAVGVGALAFLVAYPRGIMESVHMRARADWFAADIVGVREGLTETIVYVERKLAGEHLDYRMLTNHHSMAGTGWEARRYMKLYTWLPVALHPEPKSALLISYGCGQTAKSLTDTASFEQIHVVDISKDVVEMNAVVFPPDAIPTADPRLEVHIDDGRWFLQNTRQRFDLITSEPPPPENVGVVNLYTREYFQLLHDRLEDGGFVTYWLPLHSLSDQSAKAILRGFCDVFDDCSLWQAFQSSLMMVGTREAPGGVGVERFTAQWRDATVAPELQSLGFDRPEQLGALYLGGREWLMEQVADTAPLVDAFPNVLYTDFSDSDPALKARYPHWTDRKSRGPEYVTHAAEAPSVTFERWVNADATAEQRFVADPWIRRMWPDPLIDASVPLFPIQRALEDVFHRRPVDEAVIEAALDDPTLRHTSLLLLGSDPDHQRAVDRLAGAALEEPEVRYHLGARALVDGDTGAAIAHFRAASAHPFKGEDAARLATLAERVQAARAAAEESDGDDATAP